jgi:chromosomal replication initiation ATPase DnaA
MIAARQLALDLPHRSALDAEDFLVGPCNAEAVAWIDRWPDWPAAGLALHGRPGCGKTHLVHVWRARAGARAIAPARLTGADLPGLLAGGSVLALDGTDEALAKGDLAEATLLHLYNLVAEAGGALLLTGRSAPARWPLSLKDLASRLSALPAVAIGAPDDAILAGVLVKLFADRQIEVGKDVLDVLLARMERSFEAARRLVAAIDQGALAARRPISPQLVREVLASHGPGGALSPA